MRAGAVGGSPPTECREVSWRIACAAVNPKRTSHQVGVLAVCGDELVDVPARRDHAVAVGARRLQSGFDSLRGQAPPTELRQRVRVCEVADLAAPPSQQRAFFRLNHLLFKLEDAALDLPWRGHAPGDQLPLCAVIGLDDPDAPISGAVDAAGAGAVDLDAVPLLAVPLWALSPKERAEIEARLPFLLPS